MKDSAGTWVSPPPSYEVIVAEGKSCFDWLSIHTLFN